eukprot:4389431-Prymnesium_polylepis.1
MWMIQGTADFLEVLLARPLVVKHWHKMLTRDQRPATPLHFCEAVARLRQLSGDRWRATLFDIGERFLGCPYAAEVEDVRSQ